SCADCARDVERSITRAATLPHRDEHRPFRSTKAQTSLHEASAAARAPLAEDGDAGGVVADRAQLRLSDLLPAASPSAPPAGPEAHLAQSRAHRVRPQPRLSRVLVAHETGLARDRWDRAHARPHR